MGVTMIAKAKHTARSVAGKTKTQIFSGGNNHQAILFVYHIAIHQKVQIARLQNVHLGILKFITVK